MKLVREILYEKFSEESDAVKDMGIGFPYYLHTEIDKLRKIGSTKKCFEKEFENYFDWEDHNLYADIVKVIYFTLLEIEHKPNRPYAVSFFKGWQLQKQNFSNNEKDVELRQKIKEAIKEKYGIDIENNQLKENINEKFTEEDADVVKSMGIGAKIMYYRFYKVGEMYSMYISGDTFDLKDTIKHYGFKWDDMSHSWKYKSALPKDLWLAAAPKMFKAIEDKGGAIQLHGKISNYDRDFDRTFAIPGWEHWEYPAIPNGNGAKVYFKQWHHHAPMVGVMGKGSYLGRAVLRYDGYEFEKDKHMWTRVYIKDDVDDLVQYFKKNNYEVIDGRKVNEKFSADSDPIKDMGIGINAKFFRKEYDRLGLLYKYDKIRKDIKIDDYVIANDYSNMNNHEDIVFVITIVFVEMLKYLGEKQTAPNAFHDAWKYWRRQKEKMVWPAPSYAKFICQKILKDKYGVDWDAQKVYEKFQEDSDPIKDLDIGGFSYSTLKPGAIIKPKKSMRFGKGTGTLVSRGGNHVTRYTYILITHASQVYQSKDMYLVGFEFYNVDLDYMMKRREQLKKGELTSQITRYWENKMKINIKEQSFNNRFEIIERGF